ncbi:Hypothetical protein R9X50_00664500 [Acrodontium crateriforme]|uniref:AB hydrolase-1 domain-containing protein n=1 Tax=Acrodontium crateriforme TaxID=150365 RepID=A0AAQ3M884_9PEZI|nr:Hypothetical protein R9X50_00664500 [Acrodontium crateriforme]
MLKLNRSPIRRISWRGSRSPCVSIQGRRHSHFDVKEHTIRCQHMRERPAGAAPGRHNDLRLHVKQYTPLKSKNLKSTDVTIIGAHANGFPKEMYEPFWDDLLEAMEKSGRGIRSIWIADVTGQGQSGISNEDILGPDPCWWDHSRDLLYMINQFQDQMTGGPLIGIGHSVGGSHLAYLSLLHPSLLQGLVLVDPIIQPDLETHKQMARLSTNRRDTWPSRSEAAAKFKATKFYQQWDSRVLEKWIQYGLRDSTNDQAGNDGPVSLSTKVAQEVYYYLSAAYADERLLRDPKFILQQINPKDRNSFPLARPESQELFRRLPEIRPRVQYVFGKQSEASPPHARHSKLELTGIGVGGSGGAEQDQVREIVIDCGHLVAMERPIECAQACAEFVLRELCTFETEERRRQDIWRQLDTNERVDINDAWRQNLGVSSRRQGGQKN